MPSPQPIDLARLADGVVRNNVGVDAIRLVVRARRDGDTLVLPRTEQELTVTGMPEDARGPWWLLEAVGPPESPPIGVRYRGHGPVPAPLVPFPPPGRTVPEPTTQPSR